MSNCVEKISHSCGSSDGLQVFEQDGKYTGYCFSCATYVADPYHDRPVDYKPNKVTKSEEEINAELAFISTFPTLDIPSRKLRADTLDYFGVKVAVSEQDGATPIAMYFPYEVEGNTSYKAKVLDPKLMWITGKFKHAEPFGWRQALASGAKRLLITEGEPDTLALYQALKDNARGTKWSELNPAVISLRTGAAGVAKDLSEFGDLIRRNFKEVVFVFDMDAAGKKAAEDGLKIFPTATTVTLPAKDPNQCLIDGYQKGLVNAVLFKASAAKNTRLVWGSALHELGRKQAEWGLSWPWEGLTKLTRGIRFGETYYLGAGVKMGKSELVNTIGAHLIREHNIKVFMAKPEEANAKTYQLMCGKIAGRIFHDPEIEFDYDAYDEASKVIGDKLCVLNLYQHLGWETLKADIYYAVSQGCRAVFIDPITNLTNGTSAGETNTVLQEIAQELSAMAKDLDIVIFIFCHLKAPESGNPHERGGHVMSHQFAGSRAMMRSCNLMIGLEGNKDPELPEEQRHLRRLVILEDREFGATGVINLYWDKHTSLFNEIKDK